MRNLRGTYVHRGDAARWRSQLRQALFASGSIALTVLVLASRKTTSAEAEPVVTESNASALSIGDGQSRALRSELANTKGELSLVRAQFERADKIIQYSIKYRITAGMSTNVLDASLREGIDPELAFRLVQGESEFTPRAISKVGARGLTQLMPSTASMLEKGIAREQLFDG